MTTKNRIRIYLLIVLIGLALIFTNSCKKDEPTAIPIISTIGITDITATTATSGGSISSDGRATITARGICWSVNADPTTTDPKTVDGTGTGQFVSRIIELSPGTTYHVRAYAKNSAGTAFGGDISFVTLGQAPSCLIQPATNISVSGATLNGTVNANDLATTVTFEYGTTTSYSSNASAAQSPVTGNIVTTVSADITGLTSETTYHYRVKAVNSLGTTYGSDVTFSTSSVPVTDVDGNVYQTVTIGTQVWMAENLKTTRYCNGDLIGTTNPATLDISAEATPKYQWAYEGNESNANTYGRLYTWYAVTDTRNACPEGWHVPTNTEWTTLTDYLINNGYGYQFSFNDIGKSMASTSGWTTYEISGTVGYDQASNNRSGFTALPGGLRFDFGIFDFVGNDGYWWSSTENPSYSPYAYYWTLSYNLPFVSSYGNFKGIGFSVRCLQN